MGEHTKGQLTQDRFGNVYTAAEDRFLVSGVSLPCGVHPASGEAWLAERYEADANTRRIVALWNAAHRLEVTTAEIEAGILHKGEAHWRASCRACDEKALATELDGPCPYCGEEGQVTFTPDPTPRHV